MATDARAGNDKQEDLVRLLCRALSRLAVAAHGVDRRLDEMLGELRQLLRRDIDDPQQLSTLIDAIDQRIKHVDDERDVRGEVFERALQQLIEQLLAQKPASAIAGNLKSLQKSLKQKSQDGAQFALLAQLPELQAQVLTDTATPRAGVFARWFGRTDVPATPQKIELAPREETTAHEPAAPEVIAQELAVPARVEPETDAPENPVVTAMPSAAAEVADAVPDDENGEPPFTRISNAVCEVLNNLLVQIEPPPTAIDNYRHACEQIAKGLNWYELVSTLEEVSLVVLAALERGQGDFQQFLLGINQRLEEAQRVLQTSRMHQTDRQQDDARLNDTVRLEVAEMQTQVAEATQLDQLKAEVGVRLDKIVGAMDRHKSSEQLRSKALEQELAALTQRMQEMEAQSAEVERRMIEQQRLALLDTLTQLPNRKSYEQQLQLEFERWQRYRRPLVLAVCDIDNFKTINDNYGHLAGDKVLRLIAKTLRSRLRKTDFIARFGGEEFVVLLPETTAQDALVTLDAMRAAVAECPFHFREQRVAITLSAGVAPFVPGAQPDAIFERADAALYQAKQAGRDRCVLVTE